MSHLIAEDARPAPSLWHNRNFILLWFAYGISATGDHLTEMAMLKTQDALNRSVDLTPLVARMTLMFFLPFFVIAPLAGALADRVSRKGLMIGSDAARAAWMFFFALLLGKTHEWGSWGAFAPLLVLGGLAALFSPARSALLPTIVNEGQLVRANAMLSGLGIIASMIANLVGGYLAQYYHPKVAFRLDAATYALSGILIIFIIAPPVTPHVTLHKRKHVLTRGLRYSRAHRHVAELLIVAGLVWFCGALVNSVLPAIVRDTYHGQYTDISKYKVCLGAGFIIGAVLMTVLGNALRGEVAISWGLIGTGLGIALLGLSLYLPFTVRILAIMGGVGVTMAGTFASCVMTSYYARLQRTVADRFRGRVFGLGDVVTTGSLLIATAALSFPFWGQVDRMVGPIVLGAATLAFTAGVYAIAIRLSRGHLGPWLTFAEHLNEFIAKFFWRMRREGHSTIPHEGAVIVASNHVSAPDPFLLCAATPYRPISFFIAEEYTHFPVFRQFLRATHCIPVRRGTRETSATRRAIEHLQKGKSLGIFIEGGIPRPGEKGKPRDGAALLALKTGALVIPAHISGMKYHDNVIRNVFMRHKAVVRFGPPVNLSDLGGPNPARETVRLATQRIYAAIQALAPTRSGPDVFSGCTIDQGDFDIPSEAT